MDENNRNFILAIVLSMTVLFAWQFFFVPTKPPKEQQTAQTEQSQQTGEQGPPSPSTTGGAPRPSAGTAPQPEGSPTGMTRAEALAGSPRIAIETPSVRGSIALKGARIDDLTLKVGGVVEPQQGRVTYIADVDRRDACIVRDVGNVVRHNDIMDVRKPA